MWAKFTWHIEFMDCRYIFRVQCMCVCSCSKFMCRVLYVRATWNLCTKHGDLEKRSPSAGYKFLIIFSMNGRWTMYTHVYSSLSARHSVRVWLCRPVRRHYPRVRWATMWPHASDRQSSNLAMTNADSRPTNCCWFSRRPTAARRRWPRVAADRWMFPCRLSFFRTSFGWFSWWPACRRRKEFCCLSPREKRWREREKKSGRDNVTLINVIEQPTRLFQKLPKKSINLDAVCRRSTMANYDGFPCTTMHNGRSMHYQYTIYYAYVMY